MEPFFAEEGFADWMQREVEPFLKKHCQYGYLQSWDGTSVYYNRYQLQNAGKCVVICHGFCEFAEKYNEVIYYLLNAGFSVYIPEHRGHGYSDRKVEDLDLVHVEDYQEYVRDFVRFVDAVVKPTEEHCFLLAHSMGGAVGALVLEQYPGLFEAAILSAPMCGMQTGRYPGIVTDVVSWCCCMAGRGKRYAAGQGGFTGEPDFEGSSCQSRERYDYIFQKRVKNERYRTYGGSYAWVRAGRRAARRLMKRRNLARIDIPVLLFAAGWDHMVDNSKIELFAERTKKTKRILVPEAKHELFNANLTVRRRYYKEIFSFLRAQESGSGEAYLKEGMEACIPEISR